MESADCSCFEEFARGCSDSTDTSLDHHTSSSYSNSTGPFANTKHLHSSDLACHCALSMDFKSDEDTCSVPYQSPEAHIQANLEVHTDAAFHTGCTDSHSSPWEGVEASTH